MGGVAEWQRANQSFSRRLLFVSCVWYQALYPDGCLMDAVKRLLEWAGLQSGSGQINPSPDAFCSSPAFGTKHDTLMERLLEWAGLQSGSGRRARRRQRSRTCEAAGLGRLPWHLQTAILARLPLRKVLELRMVCWSWNVALRSRDVVEHVQGNAEGWLLMAREVASGGLAWAAKELLAYIPSQKMFLPLPGLPHIVGPAAACVAAAEGPFNYPTALDFALCGASGCGLLCCLVNRMLPPGDPLPAWRDPDFSLSSRGFLTDTTGYLVVVFNPLTRALHCLPAPPMLDPSLHYSDGLGISIHPHDGGTHYSLALFESPRHYDHLEIYDSRTRSWKVAQPRSAAQIGSPLSFAQGELFYMGYAEGWLFSYNLQRDVWCKISLPMGDDLQLPRGCGCYSQGSVYGGGVLRCRDGRILLAAPLALDFGHGYVGFAVFELDISHEMPRWMPLAHTPAELWQRHQRLNCSTFYFSCVTDGTLICMTGRASSDEDGRLVPLAYDLTRDLWYFLPGNKDYVTLSSFQPSLKAHPLPPLITRSFTSQTGG